MKAYNLSCPCLKKCCLASCLGILLFFSAVLPSAGQCSNTLGVRSYDTLLTGPGYGTYTISFPKWDPDSGALMSVKLSAIVSLQYKFTLKNVDITPSIYTLLVGRYDQISSPVMSTPFSNTTEQNIGVYPLNPGDSVLRAPFPFLHNYANTDSIVTQVAPFAGTGNLTFVYAPITYTDVHTNNNSSYSFSAAAADTIQFSITYQYCTIGVLASSLIRFTALEQDPSTVQLSWTMAGEEGGRDYEVQQSSDGQHFTTVASLPSVAGGTGNADYTYDWKLPAGVQTQSKWFFRLKIDDGYGGSTYSGIKMVDLGPGLGSAANGLSVYPNPAANFVNIDFDRIGSGASGSGSGAGSAGGPGANAVTGAAEAGDWQIQLFSADGRLIQQQFYSQVHEARLNFRQPLARGTYFLRATDQGSGAGGRNAVSSLLIQ